MEEDAGPSQRKRDGGNYRPPTPLTMRVLCVLSSPPVFICDLQEPLALGEAEDVVDLVAIAVHQERREGGCICGWQVGDVSTHAWDEWRVSAAAAPFFLPRHLQRIVPQRADRPNVSHALLRDGPHLRQLVHHGLGEFADLVGRRGCWEV